MSSTTVATDNEPLYNISIIGPACNAEALAEQLRNIASLLDQGYTSGYYPSWELVEKKEGE